MQNFGGKVKNSGSKDRGLKESELKRSVSDMTVVTLNDSQQQQQQQSNVYVPRANEITSGPSSIDAFLSEFIIPPPPVTKVNYGMGANFVYNSLSATSSQRNTSHLSDTGSAGHYRAHTASQISTNSFMTASEYGPKSAPSLGSLAELADIAPLPPPLSKTSAPPSPLAQVTPYPFQNKTSTANSLFHSAPPLKEPQQQPQTVQQLQKPAAASEKAKDDQKNQKQQQQQKPELNITNSSELVRDRIAISFSGQQRVEMDIKPETTVLEVKKFALIAAQILNSNEQHWALQKPGSILIYLDQMTMEQILSIDDEVEEFIIRHTQPDDFKVEITLDSGEKVGVDVNLFTTAQQCIEKLKQEDLEIMEDDWERAGLWLLPLNGQQPRFLKRDETSFSPLVTQTKYMLKFGGGLDEDEDAEMHLVHIELYEDFSRNILMKKDSNALDVLTAFIKSINLVLEPAFESKLALGLRQGASYLAIEGRQVIELNATVYLLYKTLHATLDHMDALMAGHQPHKVLENELDSTHFPSIEDIRSLITSLAWNSDDRVNETPPARSSYQLVQNSAKVAELLGVSTDMEISDVKTRLHEIYGKELSKLAPVTEPDSEDSSSKDQDVSGRKRMGKLANMLGIDNENELAVFLLEATKRFENSKKTSDLNEEDQKNAKKQHDKSVQKVARILGVNEASQQFKSRKMARNAIPNVRRDGNTRLGKNEGTGRGSNNNLSSSSKSDFSGGKPTIVNGQFVVRVYLINQTYKSIQVPADMTSDRLIAMLIERLNIKEGADEYKLLIDKRTEETLVESSVKIFDLLQKINDRDVLVFKRKIAFKRESLESLHSSENLERRSRLISMNTRRAAKVANIFGLNERKNKILEEDNPDIKAVMKMLNSLSNKDEKKRMSKDFKIEQVIKEGWLLKEEGDLSIGLSKTKNCWCYLEDNCFFVKLRQGPGSNNLALPIVFKLSDYKVSRSNTRKNGFEIVSKSNNGSINVFYADSIKSCDDWLSALRGDVPLTPISVKSSVDPFSAASTTSGDRTVSIADFEIKRVLGRGKFGKVMLCCHKSTRRVYAIKVIKKSSIREERQVANSQNENRILRSIRHPFIVSLHFAFQTPERLYLVMEYVNGGELFFHVNHFGRFSEERVRFYAAEIFLALQCLHGKGIVYRDLKLENILLDRDGHVKVTDFGLSKHEDEVDDDESVIAGTSEYLAPEVLEGKSHSYAADWWAYAVVIFEMLCGYHPFYVEDRDDLFNRIMNLQIVFPDHVLPDAADFLGKLFERDPELRLGSGPAGTLEIQNHSFFAPINFDLLFRKETEPPYKPDVTDDLDVSFFDEEFTDMPATLTPSSSVLPRASNDSLFPDFTYTRETELSRY